MWTSAPDLTCRVFDEPAGSQGTQQVPAPVLALAALPAPSLAVPSRTTAVSLVPLRHPLPAQDLALDLTLALARPHLVPAHLQDLDLLPALIPRLSPFLSLMGH